jgi:hypothetical protein
LIHARNHRPPCVQVGKFGHDVVSGKLLAAEGTLISLPRQAGEFWRYMGSDSGIGNSLSYDSPPLPGGNYKIVSAELFNNSGGRKESALEADYMKYYLGVLSLAVNPISRRSRSTKYSRNTISIPSTISSPQSQFTGSSRPSHLDSIPNSDITNGDTHSAINSFSTSQDYRESGRSRSVESVFSWFSPKKT